MIVERRIKKVARLTTLFAVLVDNSIVGLLSLLLVKPPTG